MAVCSGQLVASCRIWYSITNKQNKKQTNKQTKKTKKKNRFNSEQTIIYNYTYT
jgi:hypothetical protein